MKKIFVVVAFFLIIPLPVLANGYDDIPLDKIISKERQMQIGVEKLNNNEKENLRILLIELFSKAFEAGKKEATKAYLNTLQSPQVFESQIEGDFEGWEGETIVKLINGQIWQQQEYYYTYTYSFMPKVLIYNSGGSYKMKVEGVAGC